MKIRRTLMTVLACAITSLAVVASAAQAQQAAPSASHGAQPAKAGKKAKKVKGTKKYEYCGSNVGCGHELVLNSKKKTWVFTADTEFGGTYKASHGITTFTYSNGANAGCILRAEAFKGNYFGGFFCEFGSGLEEFETFEALKEK
jgi:hypothetical protein